MSDNIIIVNPKTGDSFHSAPEDVQAFKDKGYVTSEQYKGPPADSSPLQQQLEHPALGDQLQQAPEPIAKTNVADVDLTADGNAKVYNPKTGQEYRVTPSDLPAMQAKGYVIYSDYLLSKSQGEKDAAATKEKEDKLAIAGYGKEQLSESMKQHGALGLNLPTPIDAALAGVAGPFQDLGDLTVGKAINAVTGRTPEQQQAEIDARNDYLNQHKTAYWIGRIPAEIATAIGTEGVAEGVAQAGKVSGLTKIALKGAIYGSQPAVESILKGDYAGAAESLALSTGINLGMHFTGAVLKAGAAAVNEGISSVLDHATPEIVDEAASRKQAENLVMQEMGVPPSAREKVRNNLQTALQTAEVTMKDTPQSMVDKLQTLQDSGPAIGKAMKMLDEAEGKEAFITDALSKAQQQLSDMTSTLIGPEQKQATKALKPIQAQITALTQKPELNFSEDTQGLKRFISEQTNFSDNKLANRIRQQAYGIVKNNLIQAEDQAATKVGGAEISAGLKADRGAWALQNMIGDYVDRADNKVVNTQSLSHLLTVQRHGLFGMIGHLLVPGHGTAIGLGLSVGKTLLDHYNKQAVFGRALKTVLTNSVTPAADTVLQAVREQQQSITKAASDFFSSLAAGAKTGQVAASRHIGDWLPNGGVGKSRQQQVDELRKMATQYRINPSGVANHLATLTAPLQQEGLGQVAQAYTDHQLRLMKVLDTILPKDPVMATAHPFSNKVTKEEISPAAETTYKRALTIAADPMHVLELYKTNQLSTRDVAIAAAVNPSTLQKLRQALVEEGLKSKPDLSYQQRLSMSILMGTNIDASTSQLPVYQSVYASQAAPVQGKHKMTPAAQKDTLGSYLTGSQKAIRGL